MKETKVKDIQSICREYLVVVPSSVELSIFTYRIHDSLLGYIQLLFKKVYVIRFFLHGLLASDRRMGG
jgi:hypothetical protein